MVAGELYNASDPELANDRRSTRTLLHQLNNSSEDDVPRRKEIQKSLLPKSDDTLWIEPPFFCDYGYNIHAGEKVFFNFNCVVLDVGIVRIGSRTLIGPAVQIYTAMHPMDHQERASGLEFSKPVNIGEDVWIGGGAVICPGVTIGDRSIIGAGSVVTKDVPSDVFAAGNPCKVIRKNA